MASPGGSPPPSAPFSDFPEDVQLSILSFLRPPDLAAFACTSRRSAAVCAEPRLWSAMCHRRWSSKLQIRSPTVGVPFDLLYRALDQWDALIGFWISTCAGTPPLVSFEWDASSVTGDSTAESSSAAADPLGLEWPAGTHPATRPLDGHASAFFKSVVRDVLASDIPIPCEVARGRLEALTRGYFLWGYPEDPWMPFARRAWGFLVQRQGLGALTVLNLEAGPDVAHQDVSQLEARLRDSIRRLEILDVKTELLGLRVDLEEIIGKYDAIYSPIEEQKRRREERLSRESWARAKVARLRQELEDTLRSLPNADEVMSLNPFHHQAAPPPPRD